MSHVLFKAAEKGDAGALESLLAGGADIEWTHKQTGRTALVQATINGHRDAVAVLLRHGAAIDKPAAPLWCRRPSTDTAMPWPFSCGTAPPSIISAPPWATRPCRGRRRRDWPRSSAI